MKRLAILLIATVLAGLTLAGCTQARQVETAAAIGPLPPTTAFRPMPTPNRTPAGPGANGTTFQVQIGPEQIFPRNLNISAGDTVVFANTNPYGTKTLAFDDGYPAMTLRFQQRANRTFLQTGHYTYGDALKGKDAEINVR